MGIYDREYYRGPSGGAALLGGTAPVCKWLILVNVVVFVGQVLTYDRFDPSKGLTGILSLDPSAVLHGQVWRVLTAAFCHDEKRIFHILFNMLFLWWFGRELEPMYGSREFLTFYLTAAGLASLAFLGLTVYTGQNASMVGASGAIMAIVMLYALYYPRQKVLLFFMIPVEIRWVALGYVVVSSLPVLQALGGNPVKDHTAHIAHLAGLAYGFLYKRYDLRFGHWFANLRLPRWNRIAGPRRKLRVYREPKEDNLDHRVDEILEKISRQGEASLTSEERETLIKASRRYQNRNS